MPTWTWTVTVAGVALLVAGCPEPPAEISDCGEDTLATVPPLDMADVVALGPMGAVNPLRGPMFPDPAISLFIRPQDPRLPEGDPARVPVVAPARLWVSRVRRTVSPGSGPPTEFSFEARSCNQVTWTVEHLVVLSPRLSEPFEDSGGGSVNCFLADLPDTVRCDAAASNLEIALGEEVGLAGNWASNALGVAVRDSRASPAIFANAERAQWICPLDAFVPSVGDALRALPSAPDGRRRTAPPLCGEYMQDVPGTAAGNWFNSAFAAKLALVHDNVDPSVAIIVTQIASNLGHTWRFLPTSSGTVNRDFRQTTGDGATYCYDSSAGGDLEGIVLLQLPGDGTLLFEQQPVAGCGSGPWAFSANMQVFRR